MQLQRFGISIMLCGLALIFQSGVGFAQQNSDAAKAGAQPASAQQTSAQSASTQAASAERDGQHDFDFEVGRWNIHLKRLQDRLAGSTTWVEFDGTSVTRKVWDGRADLEEFVTDSVAGGHIEGLTLRLYNPQSHQWSLYWSNSKTGAMDPPQIGQFKDGRGEFYAMDTWKGKTVLVRFVWTNTLTKSPHFEQSYSDDGGKTWEVNWITDQTRVQDGPDKAH